jgi:hypothetical protein
MLRVLRDRGGPPGPYSTVTPHPDSGRSAGASRAEQGAGGAAGSRLRHPGGRRTRPRPPRGRTSPGRPFPGRVHHARAGPGHAPAVWSDGAPWARNAPTADQPHPPPALLAITILAPHAGASPVPWLTRAGRTPFPAPSMKHFLS